MELKPTYKDRDDKVNGISIGPAPLRRMVVLNYSRQATVQTFQTPKSASINNVVVEHLVKPKSNIWNNKDAC